MKCAFKWRMRTLLAGRDLFSAETAELVRAEAIAYMIELQEKLHAARNP